MSVSTIMPVADIARRFSWRFRTAIAFADAAIGRDRIIGVGWNTRLRPGKVARASRRSLEPRER
jgi:hypothetical protein